MRVEKYAKFSTLCEYGAAPIIVVVFGMLPDALRLLKPFPVVVSKISVGAVEFAMLTKRLVCVIADNVYDCPVVFG